MKGLENCEYERLTPSYKENSNFLSSVRIVLIPTEFVEQISSIVSSRLLPVYCASVYLFIFTIIIVIFEIFLFDVVDEIAFSLISFFISVLIVPLILFCFTLIRLTRND